MTNKELTPAAANQARELAEQGRALLAMEPEKALDAIIDHPLPVSLVRSLSPQDLYVLVAEVGAEDCLDILRMASNDQWQYMVDFGAWKGDALDVAALNRWMEILAMAAPDRLAALLAADDTGFAHLWMFANTQVAVLTEEDDPSDLGPDFFTLDNTVYIKALELPGELPARHAERAGMIRGLLERMAAQNFWDYQKLALESTGVIPSQVQEEAFRLRNMRMGEYGFLPYDEAMAVYTPLDAADLLSRPPKPLPGQESLEMEPPVLSGLAAAGTPFSHALDQVDQTEVLWLLHSEFAGLCNRIISADQLTVEGKADLAAVVRKACGFLSIGLDALVEKSGLTPSGLILAHSLEDIFRVGFGKALQLKFKAQKWRAKAWFTSQRLPLSFWGETGLGVLGGLLVMRPVYFDNLKSGRFYREFESTADIKSTQKALNRITAMDGMLQSMGLPGSLSQAPDLTCENLLLTLWAKKQLELPPDLTPLENPQLRQFFSQIRKQNKDGFQITQAAKTLFLEFVAARAGISVEETSRLGGAVFQDWFNLLDEQYGHVADQDMDGRYVNQILCQAPKV